MAVMTSLLNQAPYRRTCSSRERLNAEETCELWSSQNRDGAGAGGSGRKGGGGGGGDGGGPAGEESRRTPRPHPGCRGANGELLDLRHKCSLETCDRILLNVSGQHYETWRTTLERHPDTLLGDPCKRQKFYDKCRKEYFFDRHRPSFEAIFHYYLYGDRLRRPPSVPDDVFVAELNFFEIEKEVVNEYRHEEGYIAEKISLPDKGIQRKIWMTMEYPETSKLAYVFAVCSCVVTVVSITLFCVETLPEFENKGCSHGKTVLAEPFFILETMCAVFFTIEFLIRLVVCPSKKEFIKDLKNLVDLTAVVPYYVTLVNLLSSPGCESGKSSASLAFLRVVRLVRIFKLTKHSVGLQVLILTFKASFGGLCLFLVALIVCILVFSSAVYFAELGVEGSQINSIPDGFWYTIITMCTVGYGDVVPVGPLGKLVGITCALAGVLTLAIPVPIITENFNKFYAHKTGRGRH